MKTQTDHLKSRRHFLRGAGVALALPWMESLPLLRAQELASAAVKADPNKPPLRFACIYFSNGVDPKNWWAKGSGKEMQFGPAAEPLTPYPRGSRLRPRALQPARPAVTPARTWAAWPTCFPGAQVSNDPSDIHVGSTMDQVLAKQIGNRTQVPSHGARHRAQ